MYRIIKDLFGEGWIVVPFESPGLSLVIMIIILLVGTRFCILMGAAAIIPALVAFVITPLLLGVSMKYMISPAWLCIVHGACISLLTKIARAAVDRHAGESDLFVLPVMLIIVLIIGAMVLFFLAVQEENFIIFFIIFVTNLMGLFNFIHKISFYTAMFIISLIIQIIVAVIYQIRLSRENN